MDFLKKHYEKILLGLVLAGLVGALVFLPFYIAADKQKMADLTESIINNPSVKPLTNLDLTASSIAVARQKSPYVLDFNSTNKLFNPGKWQKLPDGSLIPVNSRVGLQVVVVTNITPLYLEIKLGAVTTNELGARYTIGVEKQAALQVAKRKPQSRYVSPDERKANDFFSLVEVRGPVENPESLALKLVDTGEVVTISREKSFRRVDAYAADFRYDPEKKVFRGRRNGDKVSFDGTDYTVADVNQNELVLEDQTNQKKTSLPFAP